LIILYILLGLIALIAVLVSVPVVLRVTFDGSEPVVRLKYLFISYSVYPHEDREPGRLRAYLDGVFKKLREKRREKKRKKKPASAAPAQPKKTTWQKLREERGFFGALGYILRIVRESASLGAYLVRRSYVSRMKVHITVGGDDAAQIAVEQGKWCAALYPALGLVLSSVRGYKKNDVRVAADFLSADNRYDVDIKLRVKPWHGITGGIRMMLNLVKTEVGERQQQYTMEAMKKAADGGAKPSAN